MNRNKKRIILFTGIGLIFITILASMVRGFGADDVEDNKGDVSTSENEDRLEDTKDKNSQNKGKNDKNEEFNKDNKKEDSLYKETKYTTEDLKIRTSPTTDGEVVGTIPQGEEVKASKEKDDWDRVKYKDIEGYSANKYLEKGPTFIRGVLLVNREHSVPANYYKDIDPEAKTQLDKMLKAAKDEKDLDLITHSDHRTHNDQKILFENYAKKDGYDKAYKYSAQPGQSEHETGLAFDICDIERRYYLKESFGESKEGIWLAENAHRFGFILRYPKDKTHITGFIYEPWHFRYVGIDHATKIYEREITLEEYLLPDKY